MDAALSERRSGMCLYLTSSPSCWKESIISKNMTHWDRELRSNIADLSGVHDLLLDNVNISRHGAFLTVWDMPARALGEG
jgi:hypothetical protein